MNDSPHLRRALSAQTISSIVGSAVLVLVGIGVAALGMSPSDAPAFFLLNGAHLIASGALALLCVRGRAPRLLCWTALIANVALAVRLAVLLLDGSVRGPLIIAAPLLFGVPAVLNVVWATSSLRRGLVFS